MPATRYRQYRDYFELRTEANKAIMAFLAGSQIARHTLSLTVGSDLLLPQVFPNVPHISRFNLKTDLAMEVLSQAEAHMGAMALPYVFAIHEDFIKTGPLALLVRAELSSQSQVDDARSHNMHEQLESVIGDCFTPASLEVFHLLRLMRNTVTHAGGKATQELEIRSLEPSADAVELWRLLVESAYPHVVAGDVVTLTHTEVVVGLAITKRLAREANQGLTGALPRDVWADVLVEDAVSTHGVLGNDGQTRRVLCGIARHDYQPLQLTEAELDAAAERGGLLSGD